MYILSLESKEAKWFRRGALPGVRVHCPNLAARPPSLSQVQLQVGMETMIMMMMILSVEVLSSHPFGSHHRWSSNSGVPRHQRSSGRKMGSLCPNPTGAGIINPISCHKTRHTSDRTLGQHRKCVSWSFQILSYWLLDGSCLVSIWQTVVASMMRKSFDSIWVASSRRRWSLDKWQFDR